jgi:hypothetical protein
MIYWITKKVDQEGVVEGILGPIGPNSQENKIFVIIYFLFLEIIIRKNMIFLKIF